MYVRYAHFFASMLLQDREALVLWVQEWQPEPVPFNLHDEVVKPVKRSKAWWLGFIDGVSR